jgi:hypothetical protein
MGRMKWGGGTGPQGRMKSSYVSGNRRTPMVLATLGRLQEHSKLCDPIYRVVFSPVYCYNKLLETGTL